MWWLGFVFHEMAFGFLSVFIPLYVVSLGGSLTHIGLMSSAAIFLSIPSSLLWGYLCDRTRRYKPYILLSFLSLAILLYLLALTTEIFSLIIIYAIMAFLHVAHEPPKNVLIAESYARRYWERAYALYGGIVNMSSFLGMLFGVYVSVQRVAASSILLICSMLNLIAFMVSIFLISDPPLIFERSLVRIERNVLRAYNGLSVAIGGLGCLRNYGEYSVKKFCLGLTSFFIATNMLFTPLPIFLSGRLVLQESLIYALFCINCLGSIVGYFLMLNANLEVKHLYRMPILRGIIVLLLVATESLLSHGLIILAPALFFMGLAYAIFHTLSLSISMEVLPERMAGMFNLLAGLGGALGSLLGPIVAENLGFATLFLITSIIFLATYVLIKTAI